MKVLISADMEGTAGVSVWQQVIPPDLVEKGAPAQYEAARSMHPTRACELIEAAAKDGVSRAKEIPPFTPPFPPTVTVRVDTADRADKMQKVPGTSRPDGDTVSYKARDGEHLMTHFLAMMDCAG